ncbi:MAG TPA: primosomal protein [Pseudonocardiaceae bacterium]|nr:primosomal protein [Pseudonocardiaceae bacterium]
MAQDIVPIELGLPQGDVVTLWAPRWREDGEEWEAFLGHDEDLYAFPDTAHLAAFVRTETDHDLADHPAWHVVPALSVGELTPDEEHQYDLVGVPELVAEDPDTWVLSELADIVAMVRSLADVCELTEVEEILNSASGFALLEQGTLPFSGREGAILWTELSEVVAERWDEVLDAIDDVVTAPDVDAAALATAQTELAELEAQLKDAEEAAEGDDDVEPIDAEADTAADADGAAEESDDESAADDEDEGEDEPVGFWAEVGIDPIKIIMPEAEYYTLRCYLATDDEDEEPLFLGADGKIDVFRSPRALARFIADSGADSEDNDLSRTSTWQEVTTAAVDGSLTVEVDESNVYVLPGIADDIAEGPDAVDPTQLDLAVELLTDAADWAGDDSVATALAPSESLGWLVSFVLRPDPTRLAPSAPFDKEEAAWRALIDKFEERLRTH